MPNKYEWQPKGPKQPMTDNERRDAEVYAIIDKIVAEWRKEKDSVPYLMIVREMEAFGDRRYAEGQQSFKEIDHCCCDETKDCIAEAKIELQTDFYESLEDVKSEARLAAYLKAAEVAELETEKFICDCHSEFRIKNIIEKIRALAEKEDL